MPFQPDIAVASALGPWDWVCFFFVLLLTVAAVIYGHYRKRQARQESFVDFILLGRQLTLPLFLMTLVATWYGGIFGVTEIAFQHGIYNLLTQGVFWYATYLIFAFVVLPRLGRHQAATLPDLAGKLFGPKSEKMTAILNIFNVLPVAYLISLGLFIQLFTDWSFPLAMGVGLGLVLLYATFGGFRAVVYSDVIQFSLMCSAVALVLLLSWSEFGGLSFLRSSLPASYFSPTGGQDWASFFAWGLIALATLVDPNFYQRCFAARDLRVAKKGIILATGVWFLFDICTTFGAMYARAVIPQAAGPHAYMTYALQLLPPGLRGLFLGGLLATILSTLDSYLFLAAATASYDLVAKKYRRVGTYFISVILLGASSYGLALYFDGSIRQVWKTLGSLSAASLLFPMMVGQLGPWQLRDHQFCLSALLGALAVAYWRLAGMKAASGVDELYLGMAASLLGLAAYPMIKKSLFWRSHGSP